jgi:hypothetical protein
MNFVKQSYQSLVYIPFRELEPVKLYVSRRSDDRWFNTLLYRSGKISWEPRDLEISWILKDSIQYEVEKDPYNIR